jgi:thioredoxin-related protein
MKVLLLLLLYSICAQAQYKKFIIEPESEQEYSNPEQMAMKSSSKKENVNLQDFALINVENIKERIKLSTYKDRPLFLTFFSPGCGFCQTMMDDLKCVKEKLPGKIGALAVGLDEHSKTMKKYITKQKLNFKAVVANKEFEKRVGGVDATPYTILLDSYGNIIGKTYGTMDCKDIVAYLKNLGFDK